MPDLRLDGVFPIYSFLHDDEALDAEAFRVACELQQLGEEGLQLPGMSHTRHEARIRIVSHSDARFPRPRGIAHLAYMRKPRQPLARQWLLAHISVDAKIDISDVAYEHREGERRPLSADETLSLAKHVLVEDIEHSIYHLCYIANIAAPGAFEIGPSFVYRDGQLGSTGNQKISDLQFAREYANSTGWPTIGALAVRDVIDWVEGNELADRAGDTPLSRAYNAWTYQFGRAGQTDPTRLFWALMGVEALFNDGKEGVKDQVIRRAQLLLGQRATHKKDLGEMYSIRSSFVHGNLPFTGQHYQYSDTAHETFQRKVWDATAIAQALLAASLQEMSRRSWSGLAFDTTVRGIPVPTVDA